MSEWRNGLWDGFQCPICRSEKYVQVTVKRRDGNWYTTEFYKCVGCSVMFTDPVDFTRHYPILHRRDIPTAPAMWGKGTASMKDKPEEG